jgi:hypothetical protein
MDNYYQLMINFAGEVFIEKLSKKQIIHRLDVGEYGFLNFQSDILDNNMKLWPADTSLIIKGEIVLPTPKRIITTHDLV